jgi:hypothetical protein
VLAFSQEIDHLLLSSPKRSEVAQKEDNCDTFSAILESLRKHAEECAECGKRLQKTLNEMARKKAS